MCIELCFTSFIDCRTNLISILYAHLQLHTACTSRNTALLHKGTIPRAQRRIFICRHTATF